MAYCGAGWGFSHQHFLIKKSLGISFLVHIFRNSVLPGSSSRPGKGQEKICWQRLFCWHQVAAHFFVCSLVRTWDAPHGHWESSWILGEVGAQVLPQLAWTFGIKKMSQGPLRLPAVCDCVGPCLSRITSLLRWCLQQFQEQNPQWDKQRAHANINTKFS